MPYAYIVENEPQLCVWKTQKQAERERRKITDSRVSQVFMIPESASGADLYALIEDSLREYACLWMA